MHGAESVGATTSAVSPLVSVVVPSYNHARYVSKALHSALAQDFDNFELLVSDDASTDQSWAQIVEIRDTRMRAFRQEHNLGPVGNLNFLINAARGKYIALLNSDDAWYAGKLRKQVSVLDSDPQLAACFTWAQLVDTDGKEVAGPEAIWRDVFRQPNRTQGEWLRHFLRNGNCLCHPSMLIRRSVYDALGLYNPGLKQLPDFEMWIRLVKHHPIHVIPENLVAHLRDGNNTSVATTENAARNLTELITVFGTFFDGVSKQVFLGGFAPDLRRPDLPLAPSQIQCEQFFLLMNAAFAPAPAEVAALSKLISALADSEMERALREDYRFSVFDVYDLTATRGLGHRLLDKKTSSHAAVSALARHPMPMTHAYHLVKQLILRARCRVSDWLRRSTGDPL